MKMKFNPQYFIVFIVLLLVEVFIGVCIRDAFIRPFVGDVLSVCVLFSMVRVFYTGNGVNLGIGLLLFAFGVEFAQFFKLASLLNLEKGSIPYVMLGATFDPLDLLAYILGTVLNISLDKKYAKSLK